MKFSSKMIIPIEFNTTTRSGHSSFIKVGYFKY